MSRSGSLAIAMAMTTRWRSPPDSSCGNDRGALGRGCAIPTSSSSSTARARAAARAVPRWWTADGLRDLIADGVHRCQRRHRILEHGADGLAADAGHPVVVEADQLLAVQPHRSGYFGILGQQPDDRHCRRRLASAGLADQCDDLARARCRKFMPRTAATSSASVGNATERSSLRAGSSAFPPPAACGAGSSASRSPSPIRLAHSMISTSMPAGNRNTHGNVVADVGAVGDQRAQRHVRWLDAEAEEAQPGFGQDCHADVERGVDDQDRGDVGQHVTRR